MSKNRTNIVLFDLWQIKEGRKKNLCKVLILSTYNSPDFITGTIPAAPAPKDCSPRNFAKEGWWQRVKGWSSRKIMTEENLHCDFLSPSQALSLIPVREYVSSHFEKSCSVVWLDILKSIVTCETESVSILPQNLFPCNCVKWGDYKIWVWDNSSELWYEAWWTEASPPPWPSHTFLKQLGAGAEGKQSW